MAETGNTKANEALGITQRTTPLAIPWTGELRVRFTDFLVNEIAEDGTVVRLTDIASNEQPPPPSKPQASSSEGAAAAKEQKAQDETSAAEEKSQPEEKPQAEKKKDAVEVSPEDQAALASIAGEAFVRGCIDMLESLQTDNSEKKSVTAEPTDDRARRAKIHQEVRRIFQSRIDTSTDDSGAIVAVAVSQLQRRGKKRGRKEGRRPPPGENQKPTAEYLHFTMYKENRDTMDAVNQIARMLRIKPQMVAFAGTKDRRAATAQRCSIRRIQQRALAGTNPKLRGVYTGNYEYKDHAMHLGQLSGNEFVITIKNCRLADDAVTVRSVEERIKALETNVQPALSHLTEHGWINYFGHQRFGTHEIGTHEVGKLILGGKFEEAVTALLSFDPEIAAKAEAGDIPQEPTDRDIALRNQACMLFMTGKAPSRAEELMPRRCIAETCILRQLNRAGAQSRRDFIGAIVHITRGLRTMYIHAYQSHVWNHVASRRWERYGSKVIKGDLVVVEDDGPKTQTPEQDEDGDDIINPEDDDDERTVRARPLTEEEASSGRYTIHDVVLPSPGHAVVYPDNDIGAYYAEFMGREENGDLDPHNMRRIRREFSLPGRYRGLMSKFIGAPSIEVKAYSNDTDQLQPTDLDLIKREKAEDGDDASGNKRLKTEGQDTPMLEATGEGDAPQKIAVVVKFQLRSSAYATIALRELMGDFV